MIPVDIFALELLEFHLRDAQEMNLSLLTCVRSLLLHVVYDPNDALLQKYLQNLHFLSLVLPRVHTVEFCLPHAVESVPPRLYEGLLPFPSLTELRNLSSLSPSTLLVLSSRTDLKRLDISDPSLPDVSIDPYQVIASLTKLCSLKLFAPTLWKFSTSLTQLTTLTRLTELKLRSAYVSDGDLALLVRSLTQIRYLDLSLNARLRDVNCVGLHLPHLLELDLSNCDRLTDSSLTSLTCLSFLRSLTLLETGVKGSGLANGQFYGTLRRLDFQLISWEGAKAYSKFTR